MEKFKSPKLLITDHYDEVIRQVDINIEELLEKYNENDLLPIEEKDSDDNSDYNDDSDYNDGANNKDSIYKIDGFRDPYRSKYKYDKNKLLRLDIIPGTTRIRDYLEVVRSKAIDELKKAEQYNLDNYELNKDLYNYDRKTLTNEKVEEMREYLFKDKFAFVVKIGELDLLKFHTVLTDFYLDANDLVLLKIFLKPLKQLNEQKSSIILNEKCLFIHFVKEYIIGLTLKNRFGSEIISITKSSLLEINRAKIHYNSIDSVNLKLTSSIDFSFIKSLKIDSICRKSKKFNDLSGLKQLEYLKISRMRLTANSFNGLNNLIKLELIHCFSSEEILCFDSLNSLQFLRIENLYFAIDLKSLENLKTLIIKRFDSLEDIINVSESITHLQLYYLIINESQVDEFFSRVFLPNLYHLTIIRAQLTSLKEEWFIGKKFMRELVFKLCCIGSLDFCRFDCLAHLEKLDLLSNKIEKLDENVFSKLKRLRYLNLSYNPILELGSNRFLGLENLETLFLDKINLRKKFKCIEKDAFNGLTNLKKLSLVQNDLEHIDPETLIILQS